MFFLLPLCVHLLELKQMLWQAAQDSPGSHFIMEWRQRCPSQLNIIFVSQRFHCLSFLDESR